MTDRKTSAETDKAETPAAASVAFMASDDEDTSTNLHQLDLSADASNAAYSLGRLEHDLQMLHSKWRTVEKEITDRDKVIDGLKTKLADAQNHCLQLEADIEQSAEDKRELDEKVSALQLEVDGWSSKGSEFSEALAERDKELDEAKREYTALLAKKHKLETDLDNHSQSAVETSDRVSTLESQNVELRVHLQELQDYIDGRKGNWDELKEQIREYEDTIKGMSDSLESHEQVVSEKEAEKAALATKVMELERSLAELKGRHTEREASHSELQVTLEEQSRELGSLNSEAIRLHKDIEKLQKKLDRRDNTIRSLRKDIKERNRDSSALEELLAEEKTTIAELQVNLTAAQQRIAELESDQKLRDASTDELGVTIGELRERLRLSEPTINQQEARIRELESALRKSEEIELSLRQEVSQSAVKVEEFSVKAAEQEIRAAELQAQLLEAQTEQKNVESELEAQRELVQVLEHDLHDKQENLNVLDRSADRLSAIGTGIRELDLQIDDLWLKESAKPAPQTGEIFEHAEEILISPEELLDASEDDSEADDQGDKLPEHVILAYDDDDAEPVQYPLERDETTIGRSRRSDIRLQSKYISRIHARIKVDGHSAVIEDVGSTNGFFVNSVQCRRHTLTNGDQLEIGDSKLRYVHN
ncbi:MAG: FHA domain-containing protein [Gammaproteobacteria bacterium]|nr:FHA domain-containing protein [Gammaproteobacteria bacterium]